MGSNGSGVDGAPKELRRILASAEKKGVAVRLTGSGHFQLRGNGWILHCSQTPRNVGRCVQNLRRQLRKEGIEV